MLDSITSRNDWGEPDSVLGTYVAQLDRLTKPVTDLRRRPSIEETQGHALATA